jgi:CRISPR-associated endoribonuclease Cas6
MDLCSLVFEAETQSSQFGFHQVFWSMIGQVDPMLAQDLQFGKGYKPYTVSPLMHGENIAPRGTASGWFRVTTLTPQVTQALLRYRDDHFDDGQTILGWQLNRIDLHSPWSDFSSYAAIYRSDTVEKIVRFRFITPTAFSHPRVATTVIMPYADLIFRNLHLRWLAFSNIMVEDLHSRVKLDTFAVNSRVLQIYGVSQRGFVGQADFSVMDTDARATNALYCLGRFALFSGIGSKTAGGMGMVWTM